MKSPHATLSALLTLLVSVACSESSVSPATERAQWLRVRPAAYSFEYRQDCFCVGGSVWLTISVRNGRAVGVALVDPADSARIKPFMPTADFA